MCLTLFSRHHQVLDSPDPGNGSACDILIKVFEVLSEVLHRFALRPVVRIILEVPKPRITLLPDYDLNGRHLTFSKAISPRHLCLHRAASRNTPAPCRLPSAAAAADRSPRAPPG